jgi:predicted CXXCH cytochrome family protein
LAVLLLWIVFSAPQETAKANRRFVHPGECSICHTDIPKIRAAQPQLCLGCHDAKSAKLAAAHRGQPFQAAICTHCHDAHASNAAKLIYEIPHGPFAGRHCDECHSEPVDEKVQISGGNVKDLCLTCHVVIGNRLASSKSAHAAMPCTACHTPHASNYRPHLKIARDALCRSCHRGQSANTAFSH